MGNRYVGFRHVFGKIERWGLHPVGRIQLPRLPVDAGAPGEPNTLLEGQA